MNRTIKAIALLFLGACSFLLPACVSVEDEEAARRSSTTTVTEETAVHRPAVSETRTIRAY